MGLTEVQIAKATRIALRAVNGDEKKVSGCWLISSKEILFLLSAEKYSLHYFIVETIKQPDWQAQVLFERSYTISPNPAKEEIVFRNFGVPS